MLTTSIYVAVSILFLVHIYQTCNHEEFFFFFFWEGGRINQLIDFLVHDAGFLQAFRIDKYIKICIRAKQR